MQNRAIVFSALATATLLGSCGVADTRDEVVYPATRPIPRAAEYRAPSDYRAPAAAPAAQSSGDSVCPGDAEELAPGSICPATAKCFDISGGRRCIDYEK
ncbi:hypothetical protein SAMN04487965_2310 [Microbulbifer donghaiensis]|uniref:Lipoprotein n=1 Tax=Microbulbifer donghaiensis TaxID=494016 RepID=A0A1M5CUV2_9GAMM|nr:hypothetical protein [Microbulbifer donghaiensis]SHF58387.1 hypothetical protein SAMN04487965_2310 [Microbulbifer donghaiensis]